MKGQPNLGLLFVGVMVGIVIGAGGLTLLNRQRPVPIEIISPLPTWTPVPTATSGPIRVFVNGEVVSPAVYTLPPGSIAGDVVEAAGGFTAQADTAVINLAFPLQDGIQIYVPAMGEAAAAATDVMTLPETRNTDIPLADTGALVNINTASLEELDALPGIGPSTAQKIIDYREENGRFATIEDIMNVSGIGTSKFEQIQLLITVGE
ncbi:MAG: helix-hairpin-helix domain-containing protein [Chloroflexota bacterium]